MATSTLASLNQLTTPNKADELLIQDDPAGSPEDKTIKVETLLQVGNYTRKNWLINGGFNVAQRGTSFTSATTPANNDDTYLLDRWVLLSDGNDIVDVTQETSVVPARALNAIKLEVETANKQFGILQIIEAKDAVAFAGQTASLQFKACKAAADDNTHSVKAVVLSWTGTADTVTSDVVSSWAASPSFAANWTAENTAASLGTLATSGYNTTYKIEGIEIDTSGMKNLAVFIFCDQTDGAVDDAIYIADVKLEIGSNCTDYEYEDYGETLQRCFRYWQQSYNDGVAAGTVTDTGMYDFRGFGGSYDCTGNVINYSMRVAPSVTVYSTQTGASGKIYNASATADINGTNFSSSKSARIVVNGVYVPAGNILRAHWTASAEL